MFTINNLNTLQCIEQEIAKEYPFLRNDGVAGKGTYGTAYNMNHGCELFIMKVQSIPISNFVDAQIYINDFYKEVGVMISLQDDGLSPHVYYHGVFYNTVYKTLTGVILMERLQVADTLIESGDVTLVDAAVEAANIGLRMLIFHGILHGDLKWDNLGYRYVDGCRYMVPFDFGLAKYVDLSRVDDCIDVNNSLLICDGFGLNVEDKQKKDLYIYLKRESFPSVPIFREGKISTVELSVLQDINYLKMYRSIECLVEGSV
jgi:hypothetical protein